MIEEHCDITAGDGWARQQCCMVRSGAVAAHAGDAQAGCNRGRVFAWKASTRPEEVHSRGSEVSPSAVQRWAGMLRRRPPTKGAWAAAGLGGLRATQRAGGLNVPGRRCTAQIWPKEVNTTLSQATSTGTISNSDPGVHTKEGDTNSAAQLLPPAAGAAAAVLNWAPATRPQPATFTELRASRAEQTAEPR